MDNLKPGKPDFNDKPGHDGGMMLYVDCWPATSFMAKSRRGLYHSRAE